MGRRRQGIAGRELITLILAIQRACRDSPGTHAFFCTLIFSPLPEIVFAFCLIFFPFFKKVFVTKFVTCITKFVTCVRKFVTAVTKFVTNFFCADSKKYQAERKKYHGEKKK